MDYTKKIADFCSELSFDKLPQEVVYKTKLCILDYIANIYGSLELEAVKNVIAYIESTAGNGNSTVFGCGFKTDMHHAAFINGTTAEAIESQDGLRFGGNHPGTAVIPATLAVSEELKLGGKEIIEAVVAGYEAANRPAMAMHPFHTLSGFLPTGTCGTFGAAVATAKLKKFNSEKMLNALSIAGYILPLSMAEQLMGGFTVKIIQGGQAAYSGIMAAGLSGAGLTGSPYIFEGSKLKGGIIQITTGNPKINPEKLIEGLGESYTIMNIYIKPFTSCRHTHGAAQATLELRKEHTFNPEDVENIVVYTYSIAQLAVGKIIETHDSFVSAQFSIPYVVAACIVDGIMGPLQVTQKRISDPHLIEFSKKIKVDTDKEINKLYPDKTASRVEIHLKNGQTLIKQVDIPIGDPRVPMDKDEISQKIKTFAGNRDLNKIQQLIDLILNLEQINDINEIIKLI